MVASKRIGWGVAVLALALAACRGELDGDTPPVASRADAVTLSTVGRTDGELSVGHDGQAHYSLPIVVPPGRAGLQPELSLAYSSDDENGLAGVGWSLNALPRITRCPMTRANDGETRGIQWDNTAGQVRLCLDGDRLIATEGRYGEDDSWYRTQHDGYRRIYLKSNVFTVTEKGGRKFTLDSTWRLDSPTGPQIYAWDASRVEDAHGNQMVVEYVSDPTYQNNHLISQISYGRNFATPGDSKTPASWLNTFTRKVTFEYEARTDIDAGRISGAYYRFAHRLRFIRTYGPTTAGAAPVLLRTYELAYKEAALSKRSLLDWVQECAPSGTNTLCLPKTTFTYQSGTLDFDNIQQPIPMLSGAPMTTEEQWLWMLHTGDFNGDGYDDILYRKPSQRSDGWYGVWYYRLSQGGSLGLERPAGLPDTKYAPYGSGNAGSVGDFNLDGKADFAIYTFDPTNQDSRFDVFVFANDAFTGAPTPPYPNATNLNVGHSFGVPSNERQPILYFGDFDGRGYPSILRHFQWGPDAWGQQNPTKWVAHANDRGVFGDFLELVDSSGAELLTTLSTPSYLVDLFGDGLDRLLRVVGRVGDRSIYRAEQINLKTSRTSSRDIVMPGLDGINDDDVRRLFVDVTGDGLSDLILYSANGGPPALSINTGNGLSSPMLNSGIAGAFWMGKSRINGRGVDDGARVIDYNGDGRNDLLLLDDGSGARTSARVLFFSESGILTTTILGVGVGRPVGDMGYKLARTLDIDGNGLTDFVQLVGNDLRIFQRRGVPGDVLLSVLDGVGEQTDLTWTRMTSSGVYTPAATCSEGTYCLRKGRQLVSQVTTTATLPAPSAVRTIRHSYKDARLDIDGRGYLGFAQHIVTDSVRGATTTYTFDNATLAQLIPDDGDPATAVVSHPYYPALGLPRSITTRVKLAAGDHVSQRDFTYDRKITKVTPQGPSYHEYLTSETDRETAPDGTYVWRTTSYEQDDLGNTTKVTRQSQRHFDEVVTSYDNSKTSKWLVGQPIQTTTTSRGSDNTQAVRIQKITWDTLDRGVPVKIEQQPAATDETYSVVDLESDGTGALIKSTVSDRLGYSRGTRFEYDSDHVFATRILNRLDHATQLTYNPGLGVVTTAVDPNGVTTGFWYDGLGRSSFVDQPDGADITISYLGSSSGAYAVRNSVPSNGFTTTHYDSWGRPVLVESSAYDSRTVLERTTYDALGRIASVTQPYFSGDTPFSSSFTYDALDRPLTRTGLDGNTTTLEPSLTRTCLTAPRGNKSCKTFDEIGEVTSSIDYEGSTPHTTTFVYGPFGLRKQIRDELGFVTEHGYDVLGRRTSFKDPDSKPYSFAYNGLGELVLITDGQQRTTRFTLDALGRAYRVEAPEGTATNTWDTAANGKGKLASTNSSTGIGRSFEYDTLGRPIKTWQSVPGLLFLNSSVTYDAYGRQASIVYPVVGNTNLTATFTYTSTGFLSRVAVPNTTVAYNVTARNAAGQITNENYGGTAITTTRGYLRGTGPLTSIVSTNAAGTKLQQLSYGYDSNLNLGSRFDQVDSTLEGFTYDYLDRLATSTTWVSGTERSQAYDYDVLNNLRGIRITAGSGTNQQFVPAGATAGPHRIASATHNGATYGYDDNGNQTSGPGRVITYTGFDLPRTITAAGKVTTFGYTDANVRAYKNDGTGNQTIYLNGVYERRITNATGTKHILLVPGERGPVAQLTLQVGSGQPNEIVDTQYLLDDHLGSIDRSANGLGTASSRGRWTPFGQRTSIPLSTVTFGFTGQEQDSEFGLTNFRGRIYDPAIGRFLTRDPIIQDPEDSRSLNPYTYVNNNPLTLTDPSGFNPEGESVSNFSLNPFTWVLSWFTSGQAPGMTVAQPAAPSGPRPPAPARAPELAGRSDDALTSNPHAINSFARICTIGFCPPIDARDKELQDTWRSNQQTVVFGVAQAYWLGLFAAVRAGLWSVGEAAIVYAPRFAALNAAWTRIVQQSSATTGMFGGSLFGGNAGRSQTAGTYKNHSAIVIRGPVGSRDASLGVTRDAFNGVDFKNSAELFKVTGNQRNTVTISYTGSRTADFAAANAEANLPSTPKGYVWHHVRDYNPTTNKGTLQLVHENGHVSTFPHSGGVDQYQAATGIKYRK